MSDTAASKDDWKIPEGDFKKAVGYIQYVGKARREENDRVWNEYNRLLRAGKDENVVRGELCERFGWSERRLSNCLLKRIGTVSEKTRVESMAKVVGTIYSMSQNVSEICENADVELDQLENRDPDEWVDIEQTATTGGKFGDTEQTKKITVRQAKQRLEDRKMDVLSKFVDAVSKLTQRNIVNVNVGDGMRDKPLDEIDAEIEVLEAIRKKGEKKGD